MSATLPQQTPSPFPAGGLDALPPGEVARKAERSASRRRPWARSACSCSPCSPGRSSRSARSSPRPCSAGGAMCPTACSSAGGTDVLAGSDPGRRRGRRAVHRQQPDRDGLGQPQPPPSGCCATGRSSTSATSSAPSRPRRSSCSAPVRVRRRRRRGARSRSPRRRRASASSRRSRWASSATRSSASPSGSPTAPARRPTRSSRSSRRSPPSSPPASSTASPTCTSSRSGSWSRATRARIVRAPRPRTRPHGGLTWSSMFADNLLPVTIGNVIGGALLVGKRSTGSCSAAAAVAGCEHRSRRGDC